MFPFSCSRASLATVLLPVSALALFAINQKGDWTENAGLDVWNLGRAESTFDAIQARKKEIQSQEQRMWQRMTECNRITWRLIERDLTLTEAVDEMLALAQRHPEWYETSRSLACTYLAVNAASDRELAAHMVLLRIRYALDDAMCQGEEASASAIRARLDELKCEMCSFVSDPADRPAIR